MKSLRGKELTTRYKWKTVFHEFCSEANSKLEEYGDVSQMVERSICMREVRGSMPRISETFWRIRQFWFVFADNGKELTTRYKWKTVFHEFCSEANSKLEENGNVSQMVERSLSMREVRGSCPASLEHFWGFNSSGLYLLIKGWIDNLLQTENGYFMKFVQS